MVQTRPRRTIDITRAERALARRRRRRIISLLVLAAFGAAGAWALLPGTAPQPPPPSPQPSTLTVLLARGAPEPLVAVVGSMGDPEPAALTIPSGLAITMPGGGEGTVADATSLPAPSMRTAVSNVIGAWAEHYAVVDVRSFSRVTEAAGAGGSPSGRAAVERWPRILEALLSRAETIDKGKLSESDDSAAVAGALSTAVGAEVVELPAVLGQAGTLRPDTEAVDRVVARLFGLPARATSVVVLNGSGNPSVAGRVAERLLPAGFRVVVSSDAAASPTTAIVASAPADMKTAERVRDVLGVGEVVVSRVPSGLAEVTVLIGEDLGNG